MGVRFGIDRLIDHGFAALRGKRIGLYSNLSATTRDLTSTVDVLHRAEAVDLVALFAPEHGFATTAADGEVIATTTDARTGLTVHSLYGANFAPTPEMLHDLDAVVCDIQDIGARYYTYLWTLTHIMEACGAVDVAVIVLDRPNPLGGRVDGGRLDPAFASLVGRYDIPVQHGMTIGELARMLNAELNVTPAQVEVEACVGWSRDMTWEDTCYPFVPPSPAMPTITTARHYPGSCLVEGTTLSEGRGTAMPFEVVGTPGVDGWALVGALNALDLPGVRFRPIRFTPYVNKHTGITCGGVQAHITDATVYRPIVTWLHVIATVKRLFPGAFGWREMHFDRLAGSTDVRARLDAGADIPEVIAGWAAYHASFRSRREAYLLYD